MSIPAEKSNEIDVFDKIVRLDSLLPEQKESLWVTEDGVLLSNSQVLVKIALNHKVKCST